MNFYAAAERALEALQDGDIPHAVDVLTAALADAPEPAGARCRVCGLRCRWPGVRDNHEASVHGFYAEDVGVAA